MVAPTSYAWVGSQATAQGLVALVSVAAIVGGGELFTTGTEWLSERFGLSESTTGSLFAALATTLPETLIPVLAIVQGSGASVGVGAIVGGPVSLTTFALLVLGLSALVAVVRGKRGRTVAVDSDQAKLDLRVFLLGFGPGIAVGFLSGVLVEVVGVALLVLYAWYLRRVIRRDDDGGELDPEPLELGRVRAWIDRIRGEEAGDHRTDPSRALVVAQLLVAVGLLLGGSHLFVEAVTWLATAVFEVPALVVALVLAPLVSNVPENVDGVIWVTSGEDVLAVEQVTGTLAFQGTVVVAIGVLFTPWDLSVAWGTADFLVAVAGGLAIVTGGVFYRHAADGEGAVRIRLLVGLGLAYAAFVTLIGYYVVVDYV